MSASAATESPAYLPLGTHAFWYHPAATALEPIAASADPTIILLFGWMAAPHSHLLNYTDAYRKMYPHATIIVVKSHLSFLWASQRALQLARFLPVFEALEALGAYEGRQRILTHSFSNGGAFYLLIFRRLLKSRTTSTPSRSALILDSSPGGDRMHLTIRALVSPIRNPLLRLLANLLAPLVLRLMYLAYGSPVARTISALEQASLLPWLDSRSPRLYLYSEKDAMIPWRDVDEHVSKCKQAGLDVRQVRFMESGHVGHARMYPEEYWGAVKMLCEDAFREIPRERAADSREEPSPVHPKRPDERCPTARSKL
ncbi:hypothetical protein MKEN_00316000 [Mycena kentingensis (nom. inval.)]|nr:hypothetical protein MKEN_00316000 [Mycena kentingensis (nom. inval.)]